MITDAAELRNGETLRADVCISGAGAAGITIARELLPTGLDVILLEGGPLDSAAGTPAESDLYEGTVLSVPTDISGDRVRGFGGTTSRWGGWCIPLEPADFKASDYPAGVGWPIDYVDLEPYFRAAQNTCDVGDLEYDANTIANREERPLLTDTNSDVDSVVYQFSEPTHFGERYRPDLDYASNVQVYTRANLVNISQSADQERIDRFECAVINGPTFDVVADKYVLAMGGIENARLLLASRDQSSRGVANRSGLVGNYFMQHPHFNSPAYLLLESFDGSFYEQHTAPTLETQGEPIEVDLCGAVKVASEQRAREQLPNAACTLHPVELNPVDDPFFQLAYERIPSLLSHLSDSLELYRLHMRAEQKPLRESTVRLGNECDALGIPRVNLNWRVAESDRAAYSTYLNVLCEELSESIDIERYWILFDEEEAQFKRPNVWGGGHHMGTTRMGQNPDSSVVNENCRTHDIENLFIAGSSVFPTGGYANPTLTIVALAHRLANYLQKEG